VHERDRFWTVATAWYLVLFGLNCFSGSGPCSIERCRRGCSIRGARPSQSGTPSAGRAPKPASRARFFRIRFTASGIRAMLSSRPQRSTPRNTVPWVIFALESQVRSASSDCPIRSTRRFSSATPVLMRPSWTAMHVSLGLSLGPQIGPAPGLAGSAARSPSVAPCFDVALPRADRGKAVRRALLRSNADLTARDRQHGEVQRRRAGDMGQARLKQWALMRP